MTIASNAVTGGHCHIWDGANLGMGAILHQKVVIGPGAMIGMGSAVRREIGAFTIAVGNPARVTGVNVVGLSRRGVDEATIEALGPWLKGKAGLPDVTLPGDLSTLVKAWDARPREEH